MVKALNGPLSETRLAPKSLRADGKAAIGLVSRDVSVRVRRGHPDDSDIGEGCVGFHAQLLTAPSSLVQPRMGKGIKDRAQFT
jgi:hypothetical protein